MSDTAVPLRSRPETIEVIELRALKTRQPELADAVDLQLALLEIQRRVQARVPLPSLNLSAERVARHAAERLPLVAFVQIPIEASDLRLVLRQTADVLLRFGLIEGDDQRRLQALCHDGDACGAAEAWFDRSRRGTDAGADLSAGMDQAIALALRPFLARCADAAQPAATLGAWTVGRCPVCGGEPELGVIESPDLRRLICGQCGLRWVFDAGACPHCPNTDRRHLTSFATADRRYHVTACEVCRRYLKSYNGQRAARPVMPTVDTLATLPLDAAAIQRGYAG